MQRTIEIIVTGKVQGVFYRKATREMADHLSLGGEVMNLPDGNVKIIVSGEEGLLQKLLEWCKEGPPRAEVEKVNVVEIPFRHFEKFNIIRL